MTATEDATRLLLADSWDTPFEAPPFDRIGRDGFLPAFEAALAAHEREIEAIAGAGEAPGFANVMEALERSGRALNRVSAVFFNLASAATDPVLEEVEQKVSPLLARHYADLYANQRLFQRVDAVHAARAALALSPEQEQLLTRYHQDFVRAGATLDADGRARMKEIMQELAVLGTRFRQNVMKDERDTVLFLEDESDLRGLPDFLREAAAAEAEARGRPGKWAISLSRSIIEPFLQFSAVRPLRETAFDAWIARGDKGETDNKPVIADIIRLRSERARLLGFESFADYKLDDTMAKTPEAALDLLRRVWVPALDQAAAERGDLQALIQAEGQNFALKPADWRYYAEKLRKQRFDLDETELKPYFQLDHMIEAAFFVAGRLFGLSFEERRDVPVYHSDVRAFEVKRGETSIGLFYGDYFARASKRSGAWMSNFRSQEKLDRDVRPIIVNVCNFAKGGPGKPALLSLSDAHTLFHEFGHGLHGLLSDVTYPSLSGTGVARDFVELPSQLFEHWLLQRDVLKRFARHAETGEPIPDALIDKIFRARHFNQGFETVEFTASALVDMAVHALKPEEAPADGAGVAALETRLLEEIGMPAEITMRHRGPHFMHIYSGDGYSAGYYSYMWSEVLDADGFGAFEEAGDIFDPAVAERLYTHIYSAGGSADPARLYRAFRGRGPQVEPLLRKRGFSA